MMFESISKNKVKTFFIIVLFACFIAALIYFISPPPTLSHYTVFVFVFFIFIFVLKSPWAVSGAFYWIEDFFKNLFQGTAYSTLKRAPVTAYGSNIRNIGRLIGSLISILFSKRFSIKKIRFGKQVLVSEGYYK